jgi:hypothetical protein
MDRPSISKLLLERNDVDVNLGDGMTPLFKAVEKMISAEVVKSFSPGMTWT